MGRMAIFERGKWSKRPRLIKHGEKYDTKLIDFQSEVQKTGDNEKSR